MTPPQVPLWAELVIAALALGGAVFTLIGAWGLAKLGDFAKRLHGPTKATTLGVGCILLASMLWFGLTGRPSLHELLIAVFLFVTAPVSAHLLIKAAIKLGTIDTGPPRAQRAPGATGTTGEPGSSATTIDATATATAAATVGTTGTAATIRTTGATGTTGTESAP